MAPKPVAADLSVEVSAEQSGGTMHYADRVTIRLRSKSSPPLVLTNPRDPAETGEFLPLFDQWLATPDARTVLLLGRSSWGAGMCTVHAWLLRVPEHEVPVIVEKLAWTTDRGVVGLVIHSSKQVRVGVPWTFDHEMHDAGEWKLEIGARSQTLSGAVLVVQRTSSALRLNPHVHAVFLEGVHHEGAGGDVKFRLLPRLETEEVALVLEDAARRIRRSSRSADCSVRTMTVTPARSARGR